MPKHYETESHAHYLTFGCYRRMWLFKDPTMYGKFLEIIDRNRKANVFELWAYVVMPNHVHLLIMPIGGYNISSILYRIKRPYSHFAMQHLEEKHPDIASKLVVEKGRRTVKRFWQQGGGYDRNVYTPETLSKTIEYIHFNPVRSGLAKSTAEWRWSSAVYYETGRPDPIEVDKPVWW